MNRWIAARRIAPVWFFTCSLGLVAAGCQGPLAPTPGFGDEVRANRDAMVANPNAGAENVALEDGITPQTAHGVLENYHEAEKYKNQEKRQKSTKDSGLEF